MLCYIVILILRSLIIRKIQGNTLGVGNETLQELGRLPHRRIPAQQIISYNLGKTICELSHRINRQIGVLIDRKGQIEDVVVGDAGRIFIPSMERYRTSQIGLNGLRFVHTHLSGETLTDDDLTDLSLLRLDLMAAIEVENDGEPGRLHAAHILPRPSDGRAQQFLKPLPLGEAAVRYRFIELIDALEEELSGRRTASEVRSSPEQAVLISISNLSAVESSARLDELEELAASAGLVPVGRVSQHRSRVNPKFFLGKGKLAELTVYSMQQGAQLWIFDQDLNPSQVKSLSEATDMRIIDRTQLILDIFAQRAHTREGKIQVELAQLKYLLPRLVGKNPAMSRLMGGIGGRGPGETKLEIDRRRARERITRLQHQLDTITDQRVRQRKKRSKEGLPMVSLVGYTNAGKSTLLNTLTRSHVMVRDQLFATLDPTSRRLYLAPGRETILTDTVGFIRDLPKDLIEAFKATLEELYDADLLLHVVDGSSPDAEQHIRAVEQILADMDLHGKPRLMVFNKKDLADPNALTGLCLRYRTLAFSALEKADLRPLLEQVEKLLFEHPAPAETGETTPPAPLQFETESGAFRTDSG